jgi:formate hydrogenlyase subunit 3/multisubunit Na+/H+ antiporter MnhD subunit
MLWYATFVINFITIGFPLSSIFFAKFLFLSTLLSVSTLLFVSYLLLFFLALPLFFVRLWVPIWFGLGAPGAGSASGRLDKPDLSVRESSILAVCVAFSLVLGCWPTFFF